MELEAKLKKLAVGLGTDFFGIADLSPAQEPIEKLWGGGSQRDSL